MTTEYRAIHPMEYYRIHMEQGIRPDGRALREPRPVIINFRSVSTADSSCTVKVGNTTVVCGITLELAQPDVNSPDIGYVVPNVELGPLCSPMFKLGPPSEKAQVTSQLLTDILSSSKCIDLHDLCIEPGKQVWCAYCDIVCLNYDGSILDSSLTAVVTALQNVSLPKVTVDSETGDIVKVDVEERTPLTLRSTPVSTSFVVHEDEILLADPTAEEESVFESSLSAVFVNNNLCNVFKPGGLLLSDDKMRECFDIAKERASKVSKLIARAK